MAISPCIFAQSSLTASFPKHLQYCGKQHRHQDLFVKFAAAPTDEMHTLERTRSSGEFLELICFHGAHVRGHVRLHIIGIDPTTKQVDFITDEGQTYSTDENGKLKVSDVFPDYKGEIVYRDLNARDSVIFDISIPTNVRIL